MNLFSSYNYKIAIRRMVRESKYSIINVVGLALGMAAALLIIVYLSFELSYDKHHENHERIYRIASDNMSHAGERTMVAINSIPVGPLLVEQVAEIESCLRIFPVSFFFRNLVYRYADKGFYEERVFSADSTFFDFFTYEFIYGQASNALTEPFSIVLTQSTADRYFGQGNPVGETIEIEGAGSFMVTAVVEDSPKNTHFKFNALFSMETMSHLDHLLAEGFMQGISWGMLERHFGNRMVWVYLKTSESFDPDRFLENTWPQLYDNHIALNEVFEYDRPVFQALSDIHLKSKLPYEITDDSNAVSMMSPELIRIFFLVAVFLLLLASVNYTNIAISRFNKRRMEVGVKKVLGATRNTLAWQFFSESVITTLASLFLALLMVEISIPFVNQLLDVQLSLNIIQNPSLVLVFAGIAVFVGLIAGGYPAMYFSSFTPLKVLKEKFKAGNQTLTLKKGLIVLQFVISVFMIVATVVVTKQMHYINNKDLGFERDRIIILELKDNLSRSSAWALKNELAANPHIADVAVSNFFPSIPTIYSNLEVESEMGMQNMNANLAQVSDEYLNIMQIALEKGRFFDRENRTDVSQSVVINEAARRQFGWDDPIGKRISTGIAWPDGVPGGEKRVIGVVEDFHYAALSSPVEPLVLFPMKQQGNYLNIRISSDNYAEGIAAIESIWQQFRPNYPVYYFVLGNIIDGMYNSQRVLTVFFAIFAALCIVIAFLGLFGLSAYTVEQRTREIGIRKVLGADFPMILVLLGKEFFWLIIIAVVIANSLAGYFMARWLDTFAYHTSLSFMPFVVGAIVAVATAFLAIVFHAWRATRLNPAWSLKYE